jgi:hypothetical protein
MSNVNPYQERLSTFFGVLSQKLRSHRDAVRRLDRFLSTRFNVFTLQAISKFELRTLDWGYEPT